VTTADRAPGPARIDRGLWVAILVSFVAVAVLGLVILSTRFRIGTASLTDDWVFAGAHASLWDYARSLFDPTHRTGDLTQYLGGRYRPSWEVAQYLQWHTLGAPRNLTGPNLWGVARTLLFAAGLVVVPGIVVAGSARRPSPVLLGALGIGVGLFVFAGPITDVDFLRLGVQEPVLVGATICGAALLILGTGRVIAPNPLGWTAVVALVCGYLLWLVGIFFKEASICVLVMAPFLYLHVDRRWRERGLIEGRLWRRRSFQVLAIAMLLPVVAVLIGGQSVSDVGIRLYGAPPPHGIFGSDGVLVRAKDAFSVEWDTLGDQAQMPIWRILIIAVTLLGPAMAIYRRRVPWLAFGFIATAWAVLDLQGFLLSPQTRFVIPAIALFGIAGFLLLAKAPPWLGYAAVIGIAVLAGVKADNAKSELNAWVDREQLDNSAVLDRISDVHPETCRVYVFNLGIEQGGSLPEMLPLSGRPLRGPCRRGFEGILVGLRQPYPGPAAAGTAALRLCADRGGPTLLARTPGLDQLPSWELLGCRKFRHGAAAARVLRRNRLVPGEGMRQVRASLGGDERQPS
jgi:hypothetical protein